MMRVAFPALCLASVIASVPVSDLALLVVALPFAALLADAAAERPRRPVSGP